MGKRDKKEEEVDNDLKECEDIADLLGVDDDISPIERENLERIGDYAEKKLPENILHFKNVQNSFPLGFIIYCDFESSLEVCEDGTSLHVPSGYAYIVVSPFMTSQVVAYSGPDVMDNFFKDLQEEYQRIDEMLSKCEPMRRLTEEEVRQHEEATNCKGCV